MRLYWQHNVHACMAACAQMILAYYGKKVPRQSDIRRDMATDENDGTHHLVLRMQLRKYGVEMKDVGCTVPAVTRQLESSHPILLSVRPWRLNKAAHAILVTEYRSGKVKVYDPFPPWLPMWCNVEKVMAKARDSWSFNLK